MADLNQPQDPNAVYDKLRQQAVQRTTAQGQGANEALQRRFAAMGNLNSGSYIQAQTQQNQQNQSNVEGATAGIDAQQMQQGFQSAEAEKGRQFQGQQAQLQREQQQKQFDVEQGNKLRQLDLADKEFANDLQSTEFNKMLSALQTGVNVDFEGYLRSKGFRAGAGDQGKY